VTAKKSEDDFSMVLEVYAGDQEAPWSLVYDTAGLLRIVASPGRSHDCIHGKALAGHAVQIGRRDPGLMRVVCHTCAFEVKVIATRAPERLPSQEV
jgi:hypothetical protein